MPSLLIKAKRIQELLPFTKVPCFPCEKDGGKNEAVLHNSLVHPAADGLDHELAGNGLRIGWQPMQELHTGPVQVRLPTVCADSAVHVAVLVGWLSEG